MDTVRVSCLKLSPVLSTHSIDCLAEEPPPRSPREIDQEGAHPAIIICADTVPSIVQTTRTITSKRQ